MSLYFTFALAFTYGIGNHASRMLLALFALHLGAQPIAVGLLAAAFSAFPTVLSLPAGRLCDRVGPRWPLFFGAAGSAGGLLVPYFFPSLPALYVAAAMHGLAFAFFNVALQNLVGLLSGPETRALNYSTFTLMVSLASFIGPVFAGFSIDHAGDVSTCLYVALVSLIPTVLLGLWGSELPGGQRAGAPAKSVRHALANPGVWTVLATSSLIQTCVDVFLFYMPVYGHSISLSASTIGIVLGMFSVSGLIVRIVVPRLLARFSIEKVLAASFLLGAVGLVLIPLFKAPWALGLLAFVIGLGVGCAQPITMMLTFNRSAEGRSGEALGLRLTVNHLTRFVGPVVFGSIGSAFGLASIFWISAAMQALGAMLSRTKGER